MTVINQSELAELTKLDQVLMWSIISINASNLDSRNTNISDNAAIRAESKDYITWQVVQDDQGNGRFTFTALLPIVNPHPLEDKINLLSRVWSYSPFDPDMRTEAGIVGYGTNKPILPSWIDTVEKLLAYVAIWGSKISKLAPLVTGTLEFINSIGSNHWGNCQYQITDSAYGSQMTITGYLTINWHTYLLGGSLIRCLNPFDNQASDVSCNFPDLGVLWSVPEVDLNLPVEDLLLLMPRGGFGVPITGHSPRDISLEDSTAQSIIDQYGQNYFIDDTVPSWYKDIIDNPPHLQTLVNAGTTITINGQDSKAPKIIESLPICKEQDPAVVNYGRSPLSSILGK
jgi:hypothetical protein